MPVNLSITKDARKSSHSNVLYLYLAGQQSRDDVSELPKKFVNPPEGSHRLTFDFRARDSGENRKGKVARVLNFYSSELIDNSGNPLQSADQYDEARKESLLAHNQLVRSMGDNDETQQELEKHKNRYLRAKSSLDAKINHENLKHAVNYFTAANSQKDKSFVICVPEISTDADKARAAQLFLLILYLGGYHPDPSQRTGRRDPVQSTSEDVVAWCQAMRGKKDPYFLQLEGYFSDYRENHKKTLHSNNRLERENTFSTEAISVEGAVDIAMKSHTHSFVDKWMTRQLHFLAGEPAEHRAVKTSRLRFAENPVVEQREFDHQEAPLAIAKEVDPLPTEVEAQAKATTGPTSIQKPKKAKPSFWRRYLPEISLGIFGALVMGVIGVLTFGFGLLPLIPAYIAMGVGGVFCATSVVDLTVMPMFDQPTFKEVLPPAPKKGILKPTSAESSQAATGSAAPLDETPPAAPKEIHNSALLQSESDPAPDPAPASIATDDIELTKLSDNPAAMHVCPQCETPVDPIDKEHVCSHTV